MLLVGCYWLVVIGYLLFVIGWLVGAVPRVPALLVVRCQLAVIRCHTKSGLAIAFMKQSAQADIVCVDAVSTAESSRGMLLS